MSKPKDPHARLMRVLDVLEDLPPTEEETKDTLAVLGIDPDRLTARLLAEADKRDAGAKAGAGAAPANDVPGAPAKKKEAPRRRIVAAWLSAGALAAAAVLMFIFWPDPGGNRGAPHVKIPDAGAEPEPDAGATADGGIPARPGDAPRPHPRR
jgi:hypothetical protein